MRKTFVLLFVPALLAAGSAWAAASDEGLLQTQTIALKKGWNAVFLEVDPVDPSPAAVFSGMPLQLAAMYRPLVSTAQFIADPSVDLSRESGWLVWYPPSRPDAFLKTLHAIYGQQAYLILAERDAEWKVKGTALATSIRWQPDAFNFVGFGVDPQAGPTYSQFFSGSSAHADLRIYRLVEDSWKQVTNPAGQLMLSGEAFWIYCDGSSKYQGPLEVKTTLKDGVLLVGGVGRIELRNRTDHPLTPTVRHVAPGGAPVPLSIVITTVNDPALSTAPVAIRRVSAKQPAGTWELPLPPIEAGKGLTVPLEARLEDMNRFMHTSLIRITTDLGTVSWLQVGSAREDLKDQ